MKNKKAKSGWGGFILGCVISTVIFLVIYSIWMNPSSIKSVVSDTKNNIQNSKIVTSQTQEDSLIAQCRQAFNDCKDITTTKYDGASISLIKIEKFTDINSSIDFFNSWKNSNIISTPDSDTTIRMFFGFNPSGCVYYGCVVPTYEDILPFVLIAAKVNRNDPQYGDISDTAVLSCDKNGKLTSKAKQDLLCG